MAEESIFRPFYTVLVLAMACSTLVAGAAVELRSRQEANRLLDQRKNILSCAGLFKPGMDVNAEFSKIRTRIVDLQKGTFVAPGQLSPEQFNQRRAAQDSTLGRPLSSQEDIAGLGRQERYSLVYLVEQGGRIDQIILPVRGKGLWSTLYAYVAVDADLTTVRGISFYEHGETPGLGGEIENPGWQRGWQGKEIYGPQGMVRLSVVKGKATTQGPQALHQIDGLSGATMTGNGVTRLLEFWFGDHGFKPFFDTIKAQGGLNG